MKKTGINKNVIMLCECAVMVALATVLSLIKIEFPYGGSITICSMLPILIVGYRYKPLVGCLTGVVYGLIQMLFGMSNKLALSLVLDTHLEEIRKKFDTLKKSASALKNQKGGLFKKTGSADFAKALSEKLDSISDCCVVRDKINHTMERYADVLLYMWANDEKFKEKFNKSKGVCL